MTPDHYVQVCMCVYVSACVFVCVCVNSGAYNYDLSLKHDACAHINHKTLYKIQTPCKNNIFLSVQCQCSPPPLSN